LRDAVSTAETGDTINFAELLTAPLVLLEGEITIDKDLTIIGAPLVSTTIDANNNSRIFNISGDNTLNLSNLNLRNGTALENGGAVLITDATVNMTNVVISASTVTGSAVTHGGGAVANIGGNLNVEDCAFQDNEAVGATSSGGAIINLNGGFLTVSETEFSNNSATRAGGAIEDNSGTEGMVTLDDVDLENNATGPSPGNGGGVHITGPGDITVT